MEGVLAKIPGLGGYLAQGQYDQQQALGQIQQLIGLSNLQKNAVAQQREAAFRQDLQALGPNPSQEAIASVAAKYASADDLLKSQTSSLDRKSAINATKEATMARLAETARMNDSLISHRISQEQNADQKLRLEQQRDQMRNYYNQRSLAIAGEKLFYDTGTRVDTSLPMPPGPSVGPQGAVSVQGSTPTADLNLNVSPALLANAAGKDPGLAKALGEAGVVIPQAQTPIPAPAPAPVGPPSTVTPPPRPADDQNLDPRDLQARAAQVQPVAAPAPVQQPAPVVEQRAKPPQWIEAIKSPKEREKAEIQWRLKNDPSAGAGAYSPGSPELEIAGWSKLIYGTEPKGLGTAATQVRTQVAKEAARLSQTLDLSPQEAAALPQDNKVKMKAVGNLTNWAATVGRVADKLDRDMQVAISLAEKMPLTQIQSITKAFVAGTKEFNDPTANAYASALNTVRQEYARMMAGPTSNAMLPVEAMKKGNEILSGGVDVPSLKAVAKVMRADAKNTLDATNAQINQLRDTILNPGVGGFMGGEKTKSGVTVSNW